MAPKAADRAYAASTAALPDVRQEDWHEIARFLATSRQLMQAGGLRKPHPKGAMDDTSGLRTQVVCGGRGRCFEVTWACLSAPLYEREREEHLS